MLSSIFCVGLKSVTSVDTRFWERYAIICNNLLPTHMGGRAQKMEIKMSDTCFCVTPLFLLLNCFPSPLLALRFSDTSRVLRVYASIVIASGPVGFIPLLHRILLKKFLSC